MYGWEPHSRRCSSCSANSPSASISESARSDRATARQDRWWSCWCGSSGRRTFSSTARSSRRCMPGRAGGGRRAAGGERPSYGGPRPSRPLPAARRPLRLVAVQQFIEYVRGLGAIGYVVYTLGYAIIGLFFPASILTIGAGALFGVVAGSIVVAIGATLAATIAFLLARTILRKRVERMVERNPKFRAVDRAIAREGAKI